jgi:hypothetical protein
VNLVTRAQWGAKAFTCSTPVPPIDGLVVHYTAANADEQADHKNCAARVRGIQSFHMSSTTSDPTKPWCDIAYNFLVCKHGSIFEGRGWNRKSGATGAANSHTIAICFLGDDTADRDDVTAAGRIALSEWINLALTKTGAKTVKGHRDYMSTSCPGNELEKWVNAGGWKTSVIKRVRFELWARHKVLIGGEKVWRPYLVDKSITVPLVNAPDRSLKFETRVLAKRAALAARNRRPVTRRVIV